MKTTKVAPTKKDYNPDPLTGESGAHPVGTGVGAAGAGIAGAAIGTALGGPTGGVVGAAVGSVIGGLAGKEAAEAYDPTFEHTYWKNAHVREPYYDDQYAFEDYEPAYRVGYGTYPEFVKLGRTFDSAESELEQEYQKSKGDSRLNWDKAKHATRAAWERLASRLPPEDG